MMSASARDRLVLGPVHLPPCCCSALFALALCATGGSTAEMHAGHADSLLPVSAPYHSSLHRQCTEKPWAKASKTDIKCTADGWDYSHFPAPSLPSLGLCRPGTYYHSSNISDSARGLNLCARRYKKTQGSWTAAYSLQITVRLYRRCTSHSTLSFLHMQARTDYKPIFIRSTSVSL